MRSCSLASRGADGRELNVDATLAGIEAAIARCSPRAIAVAETPAELKEGVTAAQVDQSIRKLVYDVNRRVLSPDARQLGKRLPDTPDRRSDVLES